MTGSISVTDSATTYSQTVAVTNTSGSATTVAGWIDFNRNGTFDSGERAYSTTSLSGSVTLTWTAPSDISIGSTFARFRIMPGTVTAASPTDVIAGGEVEDYPATIAGR